MLRSDLGRVPATRLHPCSAGVYISRRHVCVPFCSRLTPCLGGNFGEIEPAMDPEMHRARLAKVDRVIDEALDDRQTFLQVMAGRFVSACLPFVLKTSTVDALVLLRCIS